MLVTECACPACADRGATPLERDWLVCARCRCVFAPVFDEGVIAERYAEHERSGEADRIETRRQLVYETVLRRLPMPAGGRCLDVGSGAGAFVRLAAAHGWRSVGVDPAGPDEERGAVRLVRAAFPPLPPRAAPEPDPAFELVTFFNSLNHLRDPLAALREAHRVLAPGGALVVRVPNVTFHLGLRRLAAVVGPASRLGRSLRRATVLHPRSFSPRALHILLERAGFQSVSVEPSPSTEGDPYATGIPAVGILKVVVTGVTRLGTALSGRRVIWTPSLLALGRRGRAARAP